MKWFWIPFVLLAACAPATEPAADSTATSPATTPPATTAPQEPVPPTGTAPRPRPPAEANITIDSVEIANPLVIAGRARTFENNVVLRARDASGAVIAQGFTTAEGEMGQHSPYRGSLWLTRHPGSKIVVEALEHSARDGSEINLVSVERPFTVEAIDAQLVFPDLNCTGTKAFTRRLPKSVSLARLLVEVLIGGPTQEEKLRGAATPFPEGSRVESVILRDGVLTVDFNERLQNVGGSCRAQMIRTAVTKTLEALPSVERVVITAGGSEKLALQP